MIPILGIAPFPPIEPIRAGVEIVLHEVPFHAMMNNVKLSLVIGDTDRHPGSTVPVSSGFTTWLT